MNVFIQQNELEYNDFPDSLTFLEKSIDSPDLASCFTRGTKTGHKAVQIPRRLMHDHGINILHLTLTANSNFEIGRVEVYMYQTAH